MTQEQALERYGSLDNGTWPDQTKWCATLDVPPEISVHLINSATGKPTARIYCNKDMHSALSAVFSDIISEGLADVLETFDGCFMVRCIRGRSNEMSAHSYAGALDFDAHKNRLGAVPQMDPRIVEIFKKHGFAWGGDFKRLDGMHFSYLGW